MLKSFALKNFRGFKDVRTSNLARVNLITGKNNTGKTAFLEAVFLCCGFLDHESNIHRMFRSAAEQSGEDDFRTWLLYRPEDSTTGADLSAGLPDGQQRSVYLKIGSQPRNRFDVLAARFGVVSLFEADGHNPTVNSPKFAVYPFPTYPSQSTSDAVDFIYAAKKSGGEESVERLLREIEPRLKKGSRVSNRRLG